MAKFAYSLNKHGSRIHVTIPAKVAFALGWVNDKDELIIDCVRFEHGLDDVGPYGIIRPVKDD